MSERERERESVCVRERARERERDIYINPGKDTVQTHRPTLRECETQRLAEANITGQRQTERHERQRHTDIYTHTRARIF